MAGVAGIEIGSETMIRHGMHIPVRLLAIATQVTVNAIDARLLVDGVGEIHTVLTMAIDAQC
jgi:hypothetical protein